MSLMQKMILSCREVTEHCAVGELESLPFKKRVKLRMHFALCKTCRAYKAFMQKITRQVQSDFKEYEENNRTEVQNVKKGLKKDPE